MLTFPVPSQVDLPLEGLVAEAALKRLVAGVLAHVRDQVAALGERLAAHDALMRFLACNTKSSAMRRLARWLSLSIGHDRGGIFVVTCRAFFDLHIL